MTEDELLKLEQGYSESKIQHTCVCWFERTFPNEIGLLYAVPNGGWRGKRSASMCKYEGQVSGVSDLRLAHPCGGKASLCIEMKRPKAKGRPAGKQSPQQKAWQALVERHGNKYVICHGLIEFITEFCLYMHINPTPYINKALNEYPLYR